MSKMGEITTRPYDELADHDDAVILIGDIRAVNERSNHVHVAVDEGRIVGAALWHQPDDGEPDAVVVNVAPGETMRTFYKLLAACIEDTIAHGHTTATVAVHDRALLRQLTRDLQLQPVAVGRNTRTGEPAYHTVSVDLRQVLELALACAEGRQAHA